MLLHRRLHAGQPGRFLKGDLWEQQEMGASPACGQPAGRREPARVPTHHLQEEHPGRGPRHRRHIKGALADAGRHIFCSRAKARTAVGAREIVVDRFRHMHRDDGIAEASRDLGDLETGIRRVAAAVIEEVPNMVRLENLQQPVIGRAVVLKAWQLVARGAEGASRSMREPRDRGRRLLARVDQLFRQRAEDAMTAGVDSADLARMLARRHHPSRAGVDHCRNPA